MGLDKAVFFHKEHRAPYRGSKAFDHTCRNHGSCVWCEKNRKYANEKRIECAKSKESEYKRGRAV